MLPSPKSRDKAGLAVRKLACDALVAILEDGRTLDQAWEMRRDWPTDPRDRALLLRLVLTALRRKGEIDALLSKLMAKPLPRKAGPAPLILLLGATQLLFMDVPPHAAIDLAVEQARADGKARHFSGLVNAVLRRVISEGPKQLPLLDAARLNTPDWLWHGWSHHYGDAVARRIAEAHAAEPSIDVTPKSDAALWAERLGGILLPMGSIRLPAGSGAVESLPGFAEGAWWVQDAAATLPAQMLGEIKGQMVLDLCAAPGGKTLQLCRAGARVTAVDSSARRLRRVQENLGRVGFEAELVEADARQFSPGRRFDAILLDAPCSATGTIRRHPDLLYRKQAQDLEQLKVLQSEMLDHAAGLLNPGGRLVYATCSLEPQEGEMQVAAFLERHPEFAVVSVRAGEAGIDSGMVTPKGYLRTLPFMQIGSAHGLDGFFAARLVLQ